MFYMQLLFYGKSKFLRFYKIFNKNEMMKLQDPRLGLKSGGPYIIYYRRRRHHGWRGRAKKILKIRPLERLKTYSFCVLYRKI